MLLVNKILLNRRTELGISEGEICRLTGLSIYEYGDLESYPNEFLELISFNQAKLICNVLQLDMINLIENCNNRAKDSLIEPALAVNLLLKKAREEHGFTIADIADAIGYEATTIESIEREKDYIQTMCISAILDLAKVLKIDSCMLIEYVVSQ